MFLESLRKLIVNSTSWPDGNWGTKAGRDETVALIDEFQSGRPRESIVVELLKLEARDLQVLGPLPYPSGTDEYVSHIGRKIDPNDVELRERVSNSRWAFLGWYGLVKEQVHRSIEVVEGLGRDCPKSLLDWLDSLLNSYEDHRLSGRIRHLPTDHAGGSTVIAWGRRRLTELSHGGPGR